MKTSLSTHIFISLKIVLISSLLCEEYYYQNDRPKRIFRLINCVRAKDTRLQINNTNADTVSYILMTKKINIKCYTRNYCCLDCVKQRTRTAGNNNNNNYYYYQRE